MLFGATYLFKDRMLAGLGYALVEDEKPQKADAIVVLGGDVFGMRILKAAELAKAGYAPVVYVSGVPDLLGPESDKTIEFARRHGYPVSLFHAIPNSANSTRAESHAIAVELHRHDVHSILLVTSNFHTGRAARLFRKEEPSFQLTVVAAPDAFFNPGRWWKTREGQKQFLFEGLKTIAAAVGD